MIRNLESLLATALYNRQLNKFEWGRYTIYKRTNANDWSVRITRKEFGDNTIIEVDVLPEQLDPMDQCYLLLEANQYRSYAPLDLEYFWAERCRDAQRLLKQEQKTKEWLKKADILRQIFGADVIDILNMPLLVGKEYEMWMLKLSKWAEEAANYPIKFAEKHGIPVLVLSPETIAYTQKLAGIISNKIR
jgi:hypothetical protein